MITQEEIEFIKENIHKDIRELALKTHRFSKERMGFLLTQIQARQKTEKKLPSWSGKFNFVFPSLLASEQCSSEITAGYKSKLLSGERMIDLTGGLGIDVLAFCKTFKSCIHLERNKETQAAASHNFSSVNSNIKSYNKDAITFLEENNQNFDLIYLDPARRQGERKVFDFSLCEPDVLEIQSLLEQRTKKVMIKASPMINILSGIKQLKNVSEVHVISYKNECKEILFIQDFGQEIKNTKIHCTELGTEHTVNCSLDQMNLSLARGLQKFIYDPFVCFRKGGLSGYLGTEYSLKALTEEGSLLTGEKLLPYFPGRIFEVEKEIDYNFKNLKKEGISKAHIISRGFSQHADDIRKKLKIKDGGEDFIFVLKNDKKKSKLLLCKRRES